MYEHGHEASRNEPYLGHRIVYRVGEPARLLPEYKWITYGDVAEQRTALGSMLTGRLAAAGWGPHVGVLSVNRPEWIIADQAMQAYSLVNVALYDTLGPNALEYIINHAELAVVFCSGDRLPRLLEISKTCPVLKCIIALDDLPTDSPAALILRAWAADRGIELWGWSEALDVGRKALLPHRPPKSTDMCGICYTSGTTGDPKGAIYVHRMPACAIRNFDESGIVLARSFVHLSYLPLAHCYEKTFSSLLSFHGGRIGFSSGDVLRLAEDAQILKPDIFLGVPRVYNKMYDAIRAQTLDAPGLKGMLARTAYAAKLQNLETAGILTHAVWDRLLFSKVAAVLGGRVRYFITGSAPVDHRLMQFFRVMFSCEFGEGYGSTESCAYGSVLPVQDFTSGHVGRPPSCSFVKLVAVPEMSYSVQGPIPKGELCFKGPFVFPGYYKDEAKSAEAVDGDGWLHTGDIAAYNPEVGKLSIIDRKKNIFKLSQGEYVAPENLEGIYSLTNWVAQIFVHGDSLKSYLVAIVVPNEDAVAAFFRQRGRPVDYADSELVAVILADLDRMASAKRLNGYEYVKAVHLDSVPFSQENDLLTPTFKLKRHQARLRYGEVIGKLYEAVERGKGQGASVASKL
jgi:long-chain acyl-CoA synthetase